MPRRGFRPALGVTTAALALALPATPPSATAATRPQARQAYEWAALGGSYTAGLFTGPRAGHPDGCERTTNAYPDLADRRLREHSPWRPVHLRNVSCRAATITDITRTSQSPVGWGLGVADPAKPSTGWARLRPQSERAGLGRDTDVVTVGIGWNSVDLGEMVAECLALGWKNKDASPCRTHYETPRKGTGSLEGRFERIRREYASMLGRIHREAPRAEVITVGYPSLFPADATRCGYNDPTRTATLAPGDVSWLRKVEERLNRTLEEATHRFGDRYLDTYGPSRGHDVCRPAEERWAEGYCGSVAPDSNWPSARCTGRGPRLRQTYFHPNIRGQSKIADLVAHSIDEALR
ncbi:SGNH/GDSL hydrolase family protein [Streptomyces sp. NPDC059740]|uniref:SGNH/GDSL hydrolase family protein n=1 Tax=Streptomyces sp. NPDC059740 TaxID=3346926 RepID=UPI0036557A58